MLHPAQFCFTGMLVVIHILTYTPTNLINPADHIVLTPADIELRQYGSKLVLVVEETQMFTVWAIKGCFLLMYSRLTYVTPSIPRRLSFRGSSRLQILFEDNFG